MIAAPLLAFVTTHILYLNFYEFDYSKPLLQKFYFSNIQEDRMTVNLLFIWHIEWVSKVSFDATVSIVESFLYKV